MKKKVLLFTILAFFFAQKDVFAGICDGKTRNVDSDYCQFGFTYSYSINTKYANRNGSQGWLGFAFETDNNTVSGQKEYGFCLDPGLQSPEGGYSYARDLNLDYFYDFNVYRTYQYYVNAIAYDLNTGVGYANRNKYLGYTDVALRTFSFMNSDGSHCYCNSSSSGKCSNGVYNQKNCVAIFNSNTNDNEYYYQYNRVISRYISNELSTVGNGFNYSYWANSKDIEDAKDYFTKLKNNFNASNMWSNPLKITPSWSYDKENEKYVYIFEVSFTNSTSKYFDSNDSSLLNGDYDIGYGKAYFGYELLINNGAYSIEGNTLSGTSGGGCISTDSSMSCTKDNPNSTRQIRLELSKETYDSIIAQSGEVTIGLKYSTYHPMSSDNVFVNYNNDRSDNSKATHQRMIVFSKVKKEEIINNDGSSSDDVEYNICSQNGNKFYYGSNEIGIEEYEDKCTCSNINKSSITNSNILNLYNSLCPTVKKDTYSSTLNSCTTESVAGKNTVSRHTESNVNDTNKYCTMTCDETINISNFANHFTTEAGRYFKFDTYPNLVANKSCTVTVEYADWKKDYTNLLNDEISALNKLVKDNAVDHPSASTVWCSCGYMCVYSTTEYRYSYPIYYLKNNYIDSYTDSGRYGGCYNISKPSTNTSSYNKSKLYEKYDTLVNHFEKLKSCNKYLNNFGTASNYYQFTANLNFYYEQTYSSDTIGTRWNNNKPNNEDDDSKFDLVSGSTTPSESGSFKNYINDNFGYTYISASGAVNQTYYAGVSVYNNYSITRNVSYTYKYQPSVYKYTDAYTGLISSKKANLENPVILDKVYDTDVTAIAKDGNNTKYKFSSLGDKNEIYNHYKVMERVCTYKITNDILTTCSDGSCDSSLNITYRVVDPSSIDPNGRLTTNEGFQNWKDVKGQTVLKEIQATASTSDTYNPDNLEYSFTLDSATIKAIRKYNANCDNNGNCDPINYSNITSTYSKLDCNSDGNECTSKFIDTAQTDSSILGKKFATNIDGRDKWKYLDYNERKGYYIGVFNEGEISYSTLISRVKNGGEEVLP